MKSGLCILLFAGVTLAPGLRAQSTVQVASVEQAIQLAKEHNPDAHVYEWNSRIAEQELKACRSQFIPTVSAGFSGQQNLELPVTLLPGEIFGMPGQTIEARFGKEFNYSAGITASETLLDFQTIFAVKQAKVNVTASETNTAVYLQKLAEQTTLFYYRTILTRELIGVQEEDLKAAGQLLSLTEEKFNSGLADQYAVNLARINHNRIRMSLLSNRNLYEECMTQFRVLLGVRQDEVLELNENIDLKKFAFPAGESPLQPDLQPYYYQLMVQQADYSVWQARSSYYPRLTINGYFGKQQFQDDFRLSVAGDEWSDKSYWSVNLVVPVFNGMVSHHKIKSAKLARLQAEETFRREQENSVAQDKLLLTEYRNSSLSAETAKESYLLAADNFRLAGQKYEQEVMSLDNYLRVFEDYLSATAVYLNSLSTACTFYATILSRE